MNKKLIAAAVSAAVIAPVAAHAESSFYGNITNAIVSKGSDSKDAAGMKTSASSTEMDTVGSRFGIKVSNDLGNGMTASGKYEFGTTSDTDKQAFDSTRIATVGLSGGFGSVTLGQQWSSFYNTIGSMVSPNYTVSVGVGSPFRTGNTIKYANSFGPVAMKVDVRVEDDEDGAYDGAGEGVALGLTLNPLDNLTVGLAYDSSDTGQNSADKVFFAGSDLLGIAAKMDFGGFWASVGYQKNEYDEVNSSDYFVNSDGDVEIGSLVGDTILADGLADLDLGNHNDIAIESEYLQLWVGTNLGENTSLSIGYGTIEHTGSALELGGDGAVGGTGNTAIGGVNVPNVDTAQKASSETDRFAVALNHKLGGGTHLFAEYQDISTEGSAGTDKSESNSNKLLVGIRLNF